MAQIHKRSFRESAEMGLKRHLLSELYDDDFKEACRLMLEDPDLTEHIEEEMGRFRAKQILQHMKRKGIILTPDEATAAEVLLRKCVDDSEWKERREDERRVLIWKVPPLGKRAG